MGNPVSSFTLGIPFASSDGKFYSRYPQGDRFASPAVASGALPSAVASAIAGQQATSDDWAVRSVAAGIDFANRLDTQAALNSFYHSNRAPALDTAIKVTGAAASMRLDRISSDGEGATNMRIPLGPYTEGQRFWVSFRVRLSPEWLYQVADSPASGGAQIKLCILSTFAASNTVGEIVLQNTQNSGVLRMYYQDGVESAVHANEDFTSFYGSDLKWQPKINRGSNPLTGTNPDTGAAWNTGEQERAQWGGTFAPRGVPLAEYKEGIGDPISGAFRLHSVFFTATMCVTVGRWGQFDSRIQMWVAPEGEQYLQLFDAQNIRLGNHGAYDGLWFTPYVSSKIANSGRRVSARTNNIPVAVRALGLTTPLGPGTLSWNHVTQRLTWAGSGQTAGTARGFTAQKTLVNLAPASGGGHVGLEVTGTMPTQTVSDEITVASGVDPCSFWINDVLVGTQEQRAPGGHKALAVATLETAAAALAEGQRVQITGMTGFNDTNWAGSAAGAYIFQFGPRGHYDPTRKEVWYINSDHTGNQSLQKEAVYSLETNTWTFATGPDGLTGPAHTYYHQAVNRKRGDKYMKPMAFDFGPAHPTRRRIHSQGWTTVAPITEGSAIGALEWHPGLNAGAGGLVWGMTAGIYTSNAAASSWTERLNFSRGGWLHAFSVALHNRNEVYIGGGDSANDSNLRWWRVNADATLTEMSPLPKSCGVSGKAVIIPHPNGTHILAMGGAPGDKSVIRFNPITGTWSSNLGNHQFGDNGGNDYVFYVTLHELGVVMVVQSLGGGSPTCWLYKPHAA